MAAATRRLFSPRGRLPGLHGDRANRCRFCLPRPRAGGPAGTGRWTLANVIALYGAALLFLLVGGRGIRGRRPGARWFLVTVLLLGIPGVSLVSRLALQDGYRNPPRTLEAALAFVLLAVVAEEFLFRGAVYELAEDLWRRRLGPLSVTVWVSSGFFALSHFQYHAFQTTPAALEQVAYTFPMGLVLGYARQETGLIWPAIAGHVLTNLPATIWGLWVETTVPWFRVVPPGP